MDEPPEQEVEHRERLRGSVGPAPTRETGRCTAGVDKLGFGAGQVVQEFGYDGDVDDDFRFAIEDACGSELEDEDYTGEVDAVLLWWRADDGDLTDALVDTVGDARRRRLRRPGHPQAGQRR